MRLYQGKPIKPEHPINIELQTYEEMTAMSAMMKFMFDSPHCWLTSDCKFLYGADIKKIREMALEIMRVLDRETRS